MPITRYTNQIDTLSLPLCGLLLIRWCRMGPKPSANSDYHLNNWTKSMDQYYQRQQTRADLLAIAAELEALND
jgi:hypothetical protein